MAMRQFVHASDLPKSIADFLADSGFVGIQLTTDGPCAIRCETISKSSFDRLIEDIGEPLTIGQGSPKERACKALRGHV